MADHPYIQCHLLHLPQTAGNDYEGGPYAVSFSGQMYATLMVPTLDDNTTELSEYFAVMIIYTSQPSVLEIGSPNTSIVTIEDNDPGNIAHSERCNTPDCIYVESHGAP